MTTRLPLKTELIHGLKDLHLPTMRACYQEMADQAQQESLSYEHFLLVVCHISLQTLV
jgi:hypothetical protein